MSQPELVDIYKKWQFFFTLFLQSVDRRTGSLLHLPIDGGLVDQPAKTMAILTNMQSHFFEKMEEDMPKPGNMGIKKR